MSVCYYADLIVYFLAGFLLIIAWKQPVVENPPKPWTWTDRGKLYGMALIAGLLFAAIRFAMQKYFGNNTLNKVNAMLENVDIEPTKLAQVLEETAA